MKARGLGVFALVLALLAALVTAALAGRQSHRSGFKLPAVGVSPHYIRAGAPDPSVPPTAPHKVLFSCQLPSSPSIFCYGPDQIRVAYGVQPLLDKGITGDHRTIVIIDAFQSPTIQGDLKVFDHVWGLPDSTLNIIAPDGLTPFDPNDANQVGWAGEITLDVEWAHAIAPGATIDLVLAKSNNDADILSATKFVVDQSLGDVISQSFGEAEECLAPALRGPQHTVFGQALQKGITLFASSGDQGAAQPTCHGDSFIKAASTPASDPFVTGVGGTTLIADLHSGAYQSESVWNESDTFGAAGGGGFSKFYARPAFQNGFNNNHQRGVPDIAYNAGINYGVLAFWGSGPVPGGAWFVFGGTSAGSPQWAGLVALADQLKNGRLGGLNDKLYKLAAGASASTLLHDITVGNNDFPPIVGFPATPGWDAATGLGTPIANNLVPTLAGL